MRAVPLLTGRGKAGAAAAVARKTTRASGPEHNREYWNKVMSDSDRQDNVIPLRDLGSTGVKVTVLGIGGHAIGTIADSDYAVRLVQAAVDRGVRFLDNAWCYHQGRSEELMGRALRHGYRDRVFLMTKNHGRDAQTFARQLEESLMRLGTDYVDLLQFHNIVHESDPDDIFSGGAMEAALHAREQGKVRFIGFTGHHWPHLFHRMLSYEFPWDTVQMPTNLLDFHHRSFIKEVLPVLSRRRIGVIGMKALSGGHILETGVWPGEAIGYALSLPISTLVLGIDTMEVLTENVDIVHGWRPLADEERDGLLEKVAPWATDGHLERYKLDPE